MVWRCDTSDDIGPCHPAPTATRHTRVRLRSTADAARQAARRLPVWLLLGLLSGIPLPAAADTGVLSRLPAVWRDDRGRPFELRNLSGHTVVLTMAYASCHRICRTSIERLQLLQRDFDRRGASAEFVIVGYDPEHDDAMAWHQYRESRHLTRGNWHFLVGTPTMVEQTARQLGFGFWKYDQHVMHELRIVWFDEHGTLVAASEGTDLETTGPQHTEVAAQ